MPFFMKWSGRLKAGTTFTRPVIQMDLTATALALGGVRPDEKWPIDGVNLLPFLNGDQADPHAMLCWAYEKQWAIRKGQWKLTFAGPDKGEKTPVVALYDLSQDIGERQDVAAAHPDRVQEMQADWTAWRKSVIGEKPGADSKPKAAHDSP